MSNDASRIRIRDRRLLPFAAALLAAGPSWGALGWCVVLAKPVSWLPLELVWGAFALLGVTLPVVIWNRTGYAEVVDGTLRVAAGVRLEVPVGEARVVAADDARGRLALELADGQRIDLACARPTEFAEVLRTATH